MRLTGDVEVASFGAIDRDKGEELFRWRSLRLKGLKLSTAPASVAIRQLALADFGARLLIFPDAHFNLEDALGKPRLAPAAPPARATKKAAPPQPPMKITVGLVKLAGGEVRFTDRFIRPSYSTQLTELSGRVAGLSSATGTRAELELHGRIDQSGVVAVAGNVNPLQKELFIDMNAQVKDVDLPPASPYAAKYLGYGIAKGKLSFDVGYRIAKRKLQARNRIVLDQLTFGDRVRSPDAVKLPVRLAVALLKDRHGVIDVDLPLSGSLDDPHFKVWPLVWQILGNLVTKAATAPFSLLARAFGSGDDLSSVEFPPGLARLDDRAQGKLRTLAKALVERPELSFEIQGGTDPQRDRDGLRRALLERKLKAQKVAELVRGGATVGAVDDVAFQPSERSRLLAAVYKAETFPKARNALGFVKGLPPDEMESAILANTKIDDGDLRTLALRRASTVRDVLAKQAPGDARRLFVVNPRAAGGTTVELKLKVD